MYADGYAMANSTGIAGRPVLRLCSINPRTAEADNEGTMEKLESLADKTI